MFTPKELEVIEKVSKLAVASAKIKKKIDLHEASVRKVRDELKAEVEQFEGIQKEMSKLRDQLMAELRHSETMKPIESGSTLAYEFIGRDE